MDKNEKCMNLPILTRCEKYFTDKDEKYLCDKKIKNWTKLFYDMELEDLNYMQNIENVLKKSVSQLTRDDILTKMTFLLRADRHGGNRFATAVSDGSFEALCYQLHFVVYFQKGD
ncbi:MAG: hypothetical protein J6I55_12125 [Ruminococcus sp.]|nr:hypothetical protein [Ruminococcus sp.]HAE53225.1 hypothetical protein [Ruminococcus sp.]